MKTINHILILLFASGIFISCKKDHDVLGVDVQPASDALDALYSDTAKVYAHTILYDSVPTFNDRYKFLGSNQDPHFGRTDVGLYLNASIANSKTGISFGTDPNLVSAEIILTVASLDFLGTYSNSLSYSVFPATSYLDKNVVHYANHTNYHNPTSVLGTYTGSYTVMENKLVLRIPVDYNYAKSILTNPLYVDNNTVFQNNYKGFYISSAGTNLNPVSMQGSIAKFDLDDALSGFYLYYQNGTPTALKENKTFQFTFSGVDACRFNSYKYDLSSIPNNALYSQIVNKDSLKGAQNLFLKGLGSTRLKVFIPGIKNYADSFPISVNRAEVVFNLDPAFVSPGGQYLTPPKFALLPFDERANENLALDQMTETDLARYDGIYDAANNRIVFNIARQAQAIMRGVKKNLGFYLVIADPSPLYVGRRDNYAERIVLAGSANASLKPKFNLSYIKLSHDK